MRRIAASMFGVVLCLATGTAGAYAQTYYLGLGGGYGYAYESELQAGGVSGLDAAFDPGAAAVAAFGFEWVDGWRFEGEVSWRRSAFDSIDNVPVDRGRADIQAAMINVYYGFRKGATVNPYLGAGLGVARFVISDLAVGVATVDDSGGGMAWQGIAGVDFALSPAWTLSLDYRFFAVDEVKMTDSLQIPFKANYMASTAMLGLRVGL